MPFAPILRALAPERWRRGDGTWTGSLAAGRARPGGRRGGADGGVRAPGRDPPAGRPTVLLIDSLEHADAQSLQLLARLSAVAPGNCLCCSSARSAETILRMPHSGSLPSALAQLEPLGLLQRRLLLPPLTPAQSRDLLHLSLAVALPHGIRSRLVAAGDGNPLALLELGRGGLSAARNHAGGCALRSLPRCARSSPAGCARCLPATCACLRVASMSERGSPPR